MPNVLGTNMTYGISQFSKEAKDEHENSLDSSCEIIMGYCQVNGPTVCVDYAYWFMWTREAVVKADMSKREEDLDDIPVA